MKSHAIPYPRKWCITGGCGFIGTALIRRLADDKDIFIRVVDDLSVGTVEDLAEACEYRIVTTPGDTGSPGVELVAGDIRDAALAREAVRGCDAIIHLAANTGVGPSVDNPRRDCEYNVMGTFNYLDAARLEGVPRFIFASSGAPVGECTPPIHEEMPAHPVSPYGASKLCGEAYCSAYYRTYGIDTVCLRFGNVYGPGSGHKNSVVAKFISRALRGETLEIYGDGTQTRDFIYINDLLDAALRAASVPGIGGEVFQIATSKEHTIQEMTRMLLSILTESGLSRVDVISGEPRLGDVMRNFSNTSKAARLLGWHATTELEAGLKETVAWFIARHKA